MLIDGRTSGFITVNGCSYWLDVCWLSHIGGHVSDELFCDIKMIWGVMLHGTNRNHHRAGQYSSQGRRNIYIYILCYLNRLNSIFERSPCSVKSLFLWLHSWILSLNSLKSSQITYHVLCEFSPLSTPSFPSYVIFVSPLCFLLYVVYIYSGP